MRVLFLTNVPSPYRVDFFNELGKKCNLTVLFETQSAKTRNSRWVAEEFKAFQGVFLKGIRFGDAEALCPGVVKYLNRKQFDHIIVGMYSSPTGMLAIEVMRMKKIPFILSSDGGMVKEENNWIYRLKKHFVGAANAWLSTGKATNKYLMHYGADAQKIAIYPFTSVKEEDIYKANSFSEEVKKHLRSKLDIKEKFIVLSVGRFTYENGYGKGYDTLLYASKTFDKDVGVYIVGDEATMEFVEWKKRESLERVHFVGFKTKDELSEFYAAADLFVLLTKYDVWGLVVNEAMSFSLPVVTTYQCGAGVEMVQEGKNGFLIQAGDYEGLSRIVNELCWNPELVKKLGKGSYETAFNYTIENMVSAHIDTLKNWGDV